MGRAGLKIPYILTIKDKYNKKIFDISRFIFQKSVSYIIFSASFSLWTGLMVE